MEWWVVRIAVYAGSFDLFTRGHASILKGAVQVFDHVVIGIGQNSGKANFLPPGKRKDVIEAVLAEDLHFTPMPTVELFDGLLVNFCRQLLLRPLLPGRPDTLPDTVSIVRGLRAVSDFESEMGIADANRRIDPRFQTVFIPAEADLAFVSSSVVREILKHKAMPQALTQHYLFPSTLRYLP